MNLQPVILSGGAGTRLWPLSREAHPKQFLPLVGDRSLLQATVRRLDGLADRQAGQAIPVAAPIVVCNEQHRFLVIDQLAAEGCRAAAVILEPVGRNTAPALTLAALTATADGGDAVLIVMPADHVIADAAAFRAAAALGYRLACEGAVVTFGIVPDVPATGFGYLRKGEAVGDAFRLAAFVEKPDEPTARQYLESGAYLWNSGIFVLRAQRWLELIGRYRGDILDACRRAHAAATRDLDFFRAEVDAFRACPSDSIDYAVMEPYAAEPQAAARVIPLDAGWSDVGAWASLWAVSQQDGAGNAVRGDVFTHDATGNLINAQHRMVAAVGVRDLVVVETADAVLVADKARAQEVKVVTDFLKLAGRSESRYHRCVHRPWGTYEPVDSGDRFQVKRITVKPGASLSLQMHHHRAEHWIVVRGTARVTRGEEVFLLSENESTYIPIGISHRLENPGVIPLEIVEVQSGAYLGEDDIVRFEDRYRRDSKDG
jgi:mannose-1-phosphate guanylyltransferase/mannose-6-phosphate isomerase